MALAIIKNEGFDERVFRLGTLLSPSRETPMACPRTTAFEQERSTKAPHGDGLVQDFHLFPLTHQANCTTKSDKKQVGAAISRPLSLRLILDKQNHILNLATQNVA